MNVTRIACGLAIAALLTSSQAVRAQGQGHAKKQQTHSGMKAPDETKPATAHQPLPLCPVMGDPVNLAVSVATDEGPVFFCCNACVPKYEANPAKYAEKVAAQRKALADRPKVQVRCPVSGEPVDPEVFTEYEGTKVYFSSKDNLDKFLKDPGKYKAALANSYTYQTKCPVSGEEINPKDRVGDIYFCCMNCPKKFFSDLGKYTPNLEAEGYKYDKAELKREAQAFNAAHKSGSAGHHEGGGHGH